MIARRGGAWHALAVARTPEVAAGERHPARALRNVQREHHASCDLSTGFITLTNVRSRCSWPRTELDIAYHDAEWGVPLHEDHGLFELLTLEGAQAGLSWSTILRKRPGYRLAFAGFDPAKVARFTPARLAKLVLDPRIVRHRGKIGSTVANARAFLRVQRECGWFDAYLWRFVGGRPLDGRRTGPGEVPARSAESDALSADLRRRGFSFVGSTICYAFMQAAGLVNDHEVSCFRHRELAAPGRRRARPLSRGSARSGSRDRRG